MSPVTLCREVPTDLAVASLAWKIIVGAALASFLTVLLFAWHVSRQPPQLVTGEVPSVCGHR